jgi:rubrerythrin
MGKTIDDLKSAFAGESQANRKYLFFADKAAEEGYPQVARLFRAAADAETVHARSHLNVMKGVGATTDNLKVAISGEGYEFEEMYPAFIKQAKAEGNNDAEVSFTRANKVEKIHHGLYSEVLKALEAKQELKEEPFFVCQVCGNTVSGEAPLVCPVCGAPIAEFKRID